MDSIPAIVAHRSDTKNTKKKKKTSNLICSHLYLVWVSYLNGLLFKIISVIGVKMILNRAQPFEWFIQTRHNFPPKNQRIPIEILITIFARMNPIRVLRPPFSNFQLYQVHSFWISQIDSTIYKMSKDHASLELMSLSS